MLSKKHKWVLELQTNTFVDSLLVGDYKTHFKNNGIEFADFREYQSWDDAKNIDFLSSAKVWKTLIKLYEEQRQLNVYFLPFFDESINFCLKTYYKKNIFSETFFKDEKNNFNENQINKRDIFEEILYILWISTLKQQNKFWSIFYDNEKKIFFPLWKSKSHFFDFFTQIEKNNFNTISWNISQKLKYFNSLNIKNSLVFLFTWELEIDEKELKIAALKNDIVICNIFHSFENSLDDTGIIGLWNTQNDLFIDLSDEKKKQEYRQLRKQKVINFRKKVRNAQASYLYFDEKTNIFSQLFSFFKNR